VQGSTTWAAAISEFKVTPVAKRFIARTEDQLPAAIRDSAFAIPRTEVVSGKATYRGVTTEAGDYAIIALTAVRPGSVDASAPEAVAKLRDAAQATGGNELRAYIAEIESKAEIERNPQAFE
jgi:hypothetical protein